MSSAQLFHEYFQMNDFSSSPFLTKKGRKWGEKLHLKAALLAACFLLIAALPKTPSPLSQFFLCFVYFMVGVPPLIEAIEDLFNFDINIDMLMTLAAFSSVLIGNEKEGGLLLVLFAISGAMEETVSGKAKASIASLQKLSPTKACVIELGGFLIERSIQDVKIGQNILIKAGEIVPLDGIVIEGTTSLNLAHLTGEGMPQKKQKGDEVQAGAKNLEGAITLQVTKTSQDSTLSKIISLVTEAELAKPKLQRWFDRLSQNYAIAIITLSLCFGIFTPLFLSIPYLGSNGSIYRSLAFLIAASPCALIIAIPIAYLSALSSLAKQGILLKGGVILDQLASCTMVAFDKTGTLTTGTLQFIQMDPLQKISQFSKEEAFQIAYVLERNVVHPIAKALLQLAETKNISSLPLLSFEAILGFGVQGTLSFKEKKIKAFIGLPEYLENSFSGDKKKQLKEKIQEAENLGQMIALLHIEEDSFLLRFQDILRKNVEKTTLSLKNQFHLKLALLSGDRKKTADMIGKTLGIDLIFGELKPEDKLFKIAELTKTDTLAMVGDGINDAPALTRAQVGIAMGKVGSSAAIEAADIILLQDSIDLLSELFQKAHQTKAIVRQNLCIAALAILAASFPALLGFLPIWLAVIVHEGGTLLVGCNALRLLYKN